MRLSILFTTLIIFFSPSKTFAQNQKIFLFEAGVSGSKGAKTSINYVSKWNDSLFSEIGLLWFNEDFYENINGNLGIDGKISYRLDFLSIIPSVYLGIGMGTNISDSSQSFMLFEYGVTADYMYSRKLYLGLGLGAYSFIKSDSSAIDNNDVVSSNSFLINFRLTWIFGEEW